MEEYDADYIDMVVPAFIELDTGNRGRFQFGAVEGEIDYRVTERKTGPLLVEWSWVGNDGGDRISGRGWCVLEKPDKLVGRFFIHDGDDTGFKAKRAKSAK